MITRITGKNQVTVPAAIVKEADLQPGTRLDWQLADEGVLIVKILPNRATLASQLRGRGRSHGPRTGNAVASLIEERIGEDSI